jgi:hypothetical protein
MAASEGDKHCITNMEMHIKLQFQEIWWAGHDDVYNCDDKLNAEKAGVDTRNQIRFYNKI